MKSRNTYVDHNAPTWKRRPSEIRGYNRTLYFNSDDGDYLRVDYNLSEKRIRLYAEVEREGGNAYYSVISNGKITTEKSVSTGRTFGFAEKFKERADVFGTIPNKEVLRLINKNYGIGDYEQKKKANKKKTPASDRQKRLKETRDKYFKNKSGIPEYVRSGRGKAKPSVRMVDFVDVGIGSAVSIGMFIYYSYSYIALGIIAAFFGIIIGLVDMFVRNRNPFFLKIILFLTAGFGFYIYGYFLSN